MRSWEKTACSIPSILTMKVEYDWTCQVIIMSSEDLIFAFNSIRKISSINSRFLGKLSLVLNSKGSIWIPKCLNFLIYTIICNLGSLFIFQDTVYHLIALDLSTKLNQSIIARQSWGRKSYVIEEVATLDDIRVGVLCKIVRHTIYYQEEKS